MKLQRYWQKKENLSWKNLSEPAEKTLFKTEMVRLLLQMQWILLNIPITLGNSNIVILSY